MKITEYALFAFVLVGILAEGAVRLLPVIAAFAIFTALSALFYAAALGAIYLFVG